MPSRIVAAGPPEDDVDGDPPDPTCAAEIAAFCDDPVQNWFTLQEGTIPGWSDAIFLLAPFETPVTVAPDDEVVPEPRR